MNWIKPREISQFARDRTDLPSEECRQFDNLRVTHVNRSEWDSIVEMERYDVLFSRPIFSIAFGRNWKSIRSILAIWTFALESIRAVAPIDVKTTVAFQYPDTRVVISATLAGQSKQLLTVMIYVPGLLHTADSSSRSVSLKANLSCFGDWC